MAGWSSVLECAAGLVTAAVLLALCSSPSEPSCPDRLGCEHFSPNEERTRPSTYLVKAWEGRVTGRTAAPGRLSGRTRLQTVVCSSSHLTARQTLITWADGLWLLSAQGEWKKKNLWQILSWCSRGPLHLQFTAAWRHSEQTTGQPTQRRWGTGSSLKLLIHQSHPRPCQLGLTSGSPLGEDKTRQDKPFLFHSGYICIIVLALGFGPPPQMSRESRVTTPTRPDTIGASYCRRMLRILLRPKLWQRRLYPKGAIKVS